MNAAAALLCENGSMPKDVNQSPHSANVIVRTPFANHLVWIPRYRKKVLVGPVEARLNERLAEIATQYGFEILAGEGMPPIDGDSMCICF